MKRVTAQRIFEHLGGPALEPIQQHILRKAIGVAQRIVKQDAAVGLVALVLKARAELDASVEAACAKRGGRR